MTTDPPPPGYVEQVRLLGLGVPFEPRQGYIAVSTGTGFPLTDGSVYYSRRVAERVAAELSRERPDTPSRLLAMMRHGDFVLTGH